MSGNASAQRLREIYQDKTKDGVVAAADTSLVSWIAGRAKYTLFIQDIFIDILTDAAQSIIIRDTNSSPKVIFEVPASPGKGPQRINFGNYGVPLTEGKDLSVILSAAGLAFNITIQGYLKPTATMLPSEI